MPRNYDGEHVCTAEELGEAYRRQCKLHGVDPKDENLMAVFRNVLSAPISDIEFLLEKLFFRDQKIKVLSKELKKYRILLKAMATKNSEFLEILERLEKNHELQ